MRAAAIRVMLSCTSIAMLTAPMGAWGQARPVVKGKRPVAPGQEPPEQSAPEQASTADAPSRAKSREDAMTKLEGAADAGDAAAAGEAVKVLLPFAKLPDQAADQVRASLVHVEAGELAKAEKLLAEAAGASDEAFIGLALRATKKNRDAEEKAALAAIATAADPRPPAQVLVAGAAVDPDSPRIESAQSKLSTKLDKRNLEMSNAEAAHAISALATLENAAGDTVARLQEAAAELEAGRFAEAEARFRDIRLSASEKSQVAAKAVTWTRARRIQDLENQMHAAEKAKDVLRESAVVLALLDLDPKHKEANRRAKDLKRRVVAARMASVEAARGRGELGVAHWYAVLGLEADPTHAGLKKAKAEIETELKERKDLVMVVEGVKTDGSACKSFGPTLQARAMEVASRRDDLASYVLSEGWTKAWQKGDDRAPVVEGSLVLEASACSFAPATGTAQVQWAVRVPQGADGVAVASGAEAIEVGTASIPKEEQDASGKGARRAAADRASRTVSERIAESRDQVEGWLLALSAYYMKNEDSAAAADAFARFQLDPPVLYDEELARTVATYIATTYR